MAIAKNNTSTSADWIRNVQFNSVMQENFNEENFMIAKYVEFMEDLDGAQTTVKIPGVGETSIADYNEGDDIATTALATKMLTFKPDTAKAGGVEISDELLRDSYYMSQVMPYIAEDQTRVCYTDIEKYFFDLSKQLTWKVNGVEHRIAGSGTGGALALADFSKAKATIRKSAKLYSNYVAFVTPEQGSAIEQSIGINSPANAAWEPIAEKGLLDSTGMSFLYSIYGVDIYVSAFVSKGIAAGAGNADTTAKDAVMVFSATARKTPFIGAWVDRPTFTFERFEKSRRTEHYVYMCFGGKLRYPQNLVCIDCTPATI